MELRKGYFVTDLALNMVTLYPVSKVLATVKLNSSSSLELEHVDEHGWRAHDGGAPLLGHRPNSGLAHEAAHNRTSVNAKCHEGSLR